MTNQPPDGDPGGYSARNDPREWHGHRIVTGGDLGAVFAPTEEPELVRRAKRRRRLHNSVVAFLVLLLLVAGTLAQGLISGWVRLPAAAPSTSAGPVDECPAGPFPYLDTAAVEVNVYNATANPGLAGIVGDALNQRGFRVDRVGNSSVNRSEMTALVLSGPSGFAAAYTLQQHIPDTQYVRDERTDGSVDVVIGSGFSELAPAEQAAAAGPGALSCPQSETPAPAGQ
ncbi:MULTISPECIES: LytR C-terminal domain-containing protein [unclassified Arthrobacter]|uniref:LytR C-terminal domain-containing protein n=1 Tax=unclassified Arthrobacter TaxID=235627 RepID=UPI001E5F0394|nr:MULTISPECIES: LytR C-terminal domain-containing protein [unclassified Arthrobacter]MCC9146775.1 LytR C-terminal domain-containing protein [Arthrobacter sp. zg-Y919]MDK1278006.1 LytR C-terminal domain-containing protein [Arthrobacter sp. zg.Y919]WIB03403.1 LytR C-terminal domain-containing protein [Arthrobacter sp. zg-Y919]